MSVVNKVIVSIAAVFFVISISACSPEVGSDSWCMDMKEKPKGDWTSNDAKSFAQNCFFK
ncbi:hypothetical protein A9Q79_01795 [Methylophaga sp. 42_25_T18]|nr:hypothetical protein A9Q79_01795 [Methylophaga sp. 42_25_T18]